VRTIYFLLALIAISCSPSQRLAKLKKNHAEIFTTKTDTVYKEIVLKDTISIPIYRDTIQYDRNLDYYVKINKQLERIRNRPNGIESHIDEWRHLMIEVDSVKRILYGGVFEPTDGIYKDDSITFDYHYDPHSIDPLKITNIKYTQPTITEDTTGTITEGLSFADWLKVIGIFIGVVAIMFILYKVFK
jgi:hypothetical protein